MQGRTRVVLLAIAVIMLAGLFGLLAVRGEPPAATLPEIGPGARPK